MSARYLDRLSPASQANSDSSKAVALETRSFFLSGRGSDVGSLYTLEYTNRCLIATLNISIRHRPVFTFIRVSLLYTVLDIQYGIITPLCILLPRFIQKIFNPEMFASQTLSEQLHQRLVRKSNFLNLNVGGPACWTVGISVFNQGIFRIFSYHNSFPLMPALLRPRRLPPI